jgi:hypothetical protein
MRVPEELVCIHLFRQNPVFTSLHLKSPVHVVPALYCTVATLILPLLRPREAGPPASWPQQPAAREARAS